MFLKIKSLFRETVNRITKIIFFNELIRKKSVVIYYNFRAFLSKRVRKCNDVLYDVDNIVANKKHYCRELYRGNGFYGIANVLEEYSGYKNKIHACIEHGVYFGDYIYEKEACKSGLPALITFGEVRKECIRSKSNKLVFEIGPYIYYANALMGDAEINSAKERNGKTLLVFPSHSVDRLQTEFNYNSFIDKLESIKEEHSFKTVLVCLYYRDIELGRDSIYKDKGYKVVCAGRREDSEFLNRLRTFIELSDVTMSNSVGTHVGYSISLGKPHYMIKQDVEYSYDSVAEKRHIPPDTAISEKNEVLDAFSEYTEEITERQINICDKYWGISRIKSPQELKSLLCFAEEVFSISCGKEKRFTSTAKYVIDIEKDKEVKSMLMETIE